MTHPNRSKKNRTAAANPTPSEVREAREKAGHTVQQAAAMTYGTVRTWEEWEREESERRRMHPAIFELYLLKTGQKTLDQVLDEAAKRDLDGV